MKDKITNIPQKNRYNSPPMPPDFKAELNAALADACRAVAPDAAVSPAVARPKNRQMGDFASPVAMQLARVLKKSPRDIASQILRQWTPPDFVASAEAAGAGYVNIHLRPQAKTRIVRDILNNPRNFGRGADQDEFILLEFVSANPTGPLHVGHGRGAAYGDSLARILRHAGFPAAAEYYLNDAGLQMSVLAASVWLRHAHPDDWDEMPKGAYRGTYLRQAAAHLREWLAANAPDLRPAPLLEKIAAQEDEDAAANLLADSVRRAFGENQFAEFKIKVRDFMTQHFLEADLRAMGVRFDRWFSENDDLRAVGKIESALEKLGRVAPDSLYEKDGALWFRAGDFGDEKDRVARRSNGEFTYFAADIAYCEDKFSRPTPGGGGGGDPGDLCFGRGPSRLRAPPARGRPGAGARPGAAGNAADSIRGPQARRRIDSDVHPRRTVRVAARIAGRGRARRGAVFFRQPQERPAAGL